jgi:hypothetical protein
MPPELIVSGVAAILQAVQTWYQVRDSRRAARQLEERDQKTQSPEIIAAAAKLATVVPKPVLDTIQSRLEKCWTDYKKVLDHPEEFGPSETDDATSAVIKCVCREVMRVSKLNGGAIPEGPMQEFHDRYHCA